MTPMSKFEVTIEGRSYQFICDQDSPLNHAKEAHFQFGKILGNIQDNATRLQQEELEKQQQNEQSDA